MVLYSYGGRASEVWWPQLENKLARLDKLSVFRVEPATLAELVAICQRSMQLSATIQDGQLWLADETSNVLGAAAPQIRRAAPVQGRIVDA